MDAEVGRDRPAGVRRQERRRPDRLLRRSGSQRDGQGRPRHHGTRESGDRRPAQLGHRARRGRRTGSGVIDRSRIIAGDILGDIP